MLDDVLLGDNEVAFEVFPQTPNLVLPESLKDIVPQEQFEQFSRNFRPIIIRPLVRSLGGQGSMVLLLPDGYSRGRPDEPSYEMIGINDDQDLTFRRHIDHLPVARRREKRNETPKTKERLKFLAQAFLNNRLGEFLDQQHFSKSNNADLSVLFNPNALEKFASDAFMLGIGYAASPTTLTFKKGASPETQKTDINLQSEKEKLVGAIAKAVQQFKSEAMPELVVETMEALPNQQNSSLYSYLSVRLSRSKKKKMKGNSLTRQGVQANRCEVLKTFPLIASDIGRFEQHTVADLVDKGRKSAFEVAEDYWKSDGRRHSQEELTFIEGLTEHEVSARVAGTFYMLAPYLTLLDGVKQYPQNINEWRAFADVVGFDRYFEQAHFRRKGQTVREAASMLDRDVQNRWKNLSSILGFEYGDTRLSVTETITNMAGRVGLSRLAPLVLNLRDEQGLAPNLKDPTEIIAFCDVMTPERKQDLSVQARKAVEADGLSLIGRFYEKVPLSELINMQRAFASGKPREWDKQIRILAVRERFSNAAGAQKIEPLPKLPDNIQRELPRYAIVPVSTAGQAVQMIADMNSREAARILEDMVYQPVHFIFCVQSFQGETQALCVLEEVNANNGKLKVKLRKAALARDGEYIDLDDQHGELIEKIEAYIDFVNAQELPVSEFKRSRERLRLNAEKLIGERGSIGHDRGTIQENVKAANRFDQASPEALQIDQLGGLRYSCPAFKGGEGVYAFVTRKVEEIDPKYRAYDRGQGHSSLRIV